MHKDDFNKVRQGLNEMAAYHDGTGTRAMKHHVKIDGKSFTIEASTKAEFKEKLRKLQEEIEDDGA